MAGHVTPERVAALLEVDLQLLRGAVTDHVEAKPRHPAAEDQRVLTARGVDQLEAVDPGWGQRDGLRLEEEVPRLDGDRRDRRTRRLLVAAAATPAAATGQHQRGDHDRSGHAPRPAQPAGAPSRRPHDQPPAFAVVGVLAEAPGAGAGAAAPTVTVACIPAARWPRMG